MEMPTMGQSLPSSLATTQGPGVWLPWARAKWSPVSHSLQLSPPGLGARARQKCSPVSKPAEVRGLIHSLPLPSPVSLRGKAGPAAHPSWALSPLTSWALGLPLAPSGAHCENPWAARQTRHLENKLHSNQAALEKPGAMAGIPSPPWPSCQRGLPKNIVVLPFCHAPHPRERGVACQDGRQDSSVGGCCSPETGVPTSAGPEQTRRTGSSDPDMAHGQCPQL